MAHLHQLVCDGVAAQISEYGASLRGLQVDGVDLVWGSPHATPPMSAGITLIPWTNRIDGGLWAWNGTIQQLAITEPELNNAIHGLVATTRFAPALVRADFVRLESSIANAPGYPFRLRIAIEYRVHRRGLDVTTIITNVGECPSPVAVGAHPYLRLGDTAADDIDITIRAESAYELDERYIPHGRASVEGTPVDLRSGMPASRAVRHVCYSDLEVVEGRVSHRLRAVDGAEVEVWADPRFRYAQLFISSEFPGVPDGQLAIAIEPMTAPPNALRAGTDLEWLDPDETWTLTWGIRVIDATHAPSAAADS